MPTPTYTPLANITLSSSATTVSFSSINQSYKDIILIANFRPDYSSLVGIRINGDTSSSYRYVNMSNTISPSYNSSTATSSKIYINSNTNLSPSTKVSLITNFMDYTSTDKFKHIICRMNNYEATIVSSAGRWNSTSSMTSFSIDTDGGTFASGSSFSIFGVIA